MDEARWSRVQQLFDDVLDLPEEHRDGYLRRAAAGDVALFEEVQSLVAAHDGSFRLTQVVEQEALALCERKPRADAIPPYEVRDVLGEGAMGVVYRAFDPRLDRTVAIKLLQPSLALIPEARQRFLQEARLASSLDHPNICTIHDVGQRADGVRIRTADKSSSAPGKAWVRRMRCRRS